MEAVLAAEVSARPTTDPPELQALIRRIANENPAWDEERIANELLLKIGIRVSPRTVNKYLPRPRGRPRGDLRWATFLRLHAQAIVACDFFIVVTATFRQLYVFVVIEHHSRRLIHHNVTSHPSAAWTLQQLREVVGYDDLCRFLIHDFDCIFASQLDESIRALGIRVLKSAPHNPKMKAKTSYCLLFRLSNVDDLSRLFHGARAVLMHSKSPPEWLSELMKRRPKNVAVVAMANKMARTIWALTAHERAYQSGYVSRPGLRVEITVN